jgi:hypothetical protein
VPTLEIESQQYDYEYYNSNMPSGIRDKEPVARLWNPTPEHGKGESHVFHNRFRLLPLVGEGVFSARKAREEALELAHKDLSIPRNLTLRAGQIKELDEGLFVKKTREGSLEIYVSEE